MKKAEFRSDDRMAKPPQDAVLLRTIGSWRILFSDPEQSLYIVSMDYHPEPLRIHRRELKELKRLMKAASKGFWRRLGRRHENKPEA